MSWLLALLLLGGPARGDDNLEGVDAQTAQGAGLERAMKETLASDPSVADSLAARIARSTLADRITTSADPAARLADIRKWIQESPGSAAQMAVGLAQDDAEGSRRFETAVQRNTHRSFNLNQEHVTKSTYGRLRKSSLDSKLMRQDEQMTEEEKREVLKTMFEGQGGMSNQIITQEDRGRTPDDRGAVGAGGFSAGYYDRLSRLNLRGYSPQLMAIQNALNQRRAPGAPRLVETGQLDYATLSYPAYGMRYDLRNLETRLRYQRSFELARAAGLSGRYSPEELLSPEVEALLQAKAAGARPHPAFARRLAALQRAAAALQGFAAAAVAAQDPARLSRELLLDLGARQKEGARWITAASLEEELQRIESEEGFLSPELLALIDACPLPGTTRSAYQRRGEGFRQSLLQMKANAESAIKKLASDAWQSETAAVEAALAENSRLRRTLSRDIRNFVNVPYRLRSLYEPVPRWKSLLEGAAARWLPSSSWGRRVRQRDRERETLKDVFGKIATGDLDAADVVMAASAPSGGPPSKR